MRPLTTLDRRTLVKSLSLLTIVGLPAAVQAKVAAAGLIFTDVCLLTPEVTEGPFYLDPNLIRQDITEGRPGLPMQLRLQVVTADCAPVCGSTFGPSRLVSGADTPYPLKEYPLGSDGSGQPAVFAEPVMAGV